MIKLQNFFFFITSMVVPRGTAAPILLKWFVSRDVPTGAPSSNGTIIPIPIPLFPVLVYLHSKKLIRSMESGVAKNRILVRASCPTLLASIIGRSSSENGARNAAFRFVLVLHFLLLESKGDLSYFESFCAVLCLLFFRTLFSLPCDRSAKREQMGGRKGQTFRPNGNEQDPNEKMRCPGHTKMKKERVALALPISRQLMALGHDYYKNKTQMKINISHGGVCIFILGILLSNTGKLQFTQRLPLGSELHMGNERCCLRGIDHLHGPTSHSICGNLMIYKPDLTDERLIFEEILEESGALLRPDFLMSIPISYTKGRLEHFLQQWNKKSEEKNFFFPMFPEKRYFFSSREITSTTEVAIHTNLLTDLYATIGTGSSITGGWYTTIMKLPFIFCIRIGFILASTGGSLSLVRQLKKDKLHWN